MDFGREYYDMLGAQGGERIPFYMTYPMHNSFLEEAEYDRDCRKLQALYPKDARRIQETVSRECDKMEYEGSMMFDEYPDRLSVHLLARKIYREVWNGSDDGKFAGENTGTAFVRKYSIEETGTDENYAGLQVENCQSGRCHPAGSDPHDPLMQLVEVMLMQEMYRRRCRHLRCRRWY